MDRFDRAYFSTRVELSQFGRALRVYWKRIAIGAFVGWLVAVLGGAVLLSALEVNGVLTRDTADGLSVIVVLYGVGIGALNAYTFRPEARRARSRR